MMFKIGIFGSAVNEGKDVLKKARELGKELGKKNISIITGACSGLPYQVALEASKSGVEIYGYSPVLNIREQKEFTPEDDLLIYKKIFFIPKRFEFATSADVCKKYRNVVSIANCDGGIIISGRWGTMNEFTNLYDMGKVIGILTETGGIADELKRLTLIVNKKSNAKLIFDSSPKELVKKVIEEIKNRSYN